MTMHGKDEARQFLTYCREDRGLLDKTLHDYATELDLALKWCEKHKLSIIELSRTQIMQCCKRYTQAGRAPAKNTINTRLAIIKAFYRWLWENEYIPENTASKVRAVKTPTARPKPIEIGDWLKLWSHANGPRTRAALVCTHYLGMRGDEVRQLRTEQIKPNLIQGLHRKGDERMDLPWKRMLIILAHGLPQVMPPNMSEAFEALNVVKRYETIWPAGAGASWLRGQYSELAAKAGLPNINPHRARASALTNLLRAGVRIEHAKYLLNITGWRTITHYLKISGVDFDMWFDAWYGRAGGEQWTSE